MLTFIAIRATSKDEGASPVWSAAACRRFARQDACLLPRKQASARDSGSEFPYSIARTEG